MTFVIAIDYHLLVPQVQNFDTIKSKKKVKNPFKRLSKKLKTKIKKRRDSENTISTAVNTRRVSFSSIGSIGGDLRRASFSSITSIGEDIRRASFSSITSITEELFDQCTDCGSRATKKNPLTQRPRGMCANEDCDAFLCKECKNNHVLIPLRCESDKENWRNAKIERFCRDCFMEVSILDFQKFTDVIEPKDPSKKKSGVTIIFVHGAGGSRATFREHAQMLADEYGHRGILVDLAGHGSRWNEECTLENCENAILEALREHCIKTAEEEAKHGNYTLLLGGSWGGYIVYYTLAKNPEYFAGAILEGSTVDMNNPREKLKWGMITSIVNRSSYHQQCKFIKKNWGRKNYDYVVETKLGAGLFGRANPFHSIQNHNFWEWIPLIQCPCLFLNGTADHDGYDPVTQKKIFGLLAKKEESTIKLFEGGDHIFGCDRRFINEWMKSIQMFSRNIVLRDEHDVQNDNGDSGLDDVFEAVDVKTDAFVHSGAMCLVCSDSVEAV